MLNILLIEDKKEDALIIKKALATSAKSTKKFDFIWAERLDEGITKIKHGKKKIHFILLDLSLPGSRGLETLDLLLKEVKKIPVAVLSTLEDEKIAEEAIKMGAQDYMLKENIIPDTLRRVIIYAIERSKILNEKKKLILQLWQANENIKILKGLLPICSRCKKIRSDKGNWQQIDEYVEEHSEADFSHSICPDCVKDLYPELSD